MFNVIRHVELYITYVVGLIKHHHRLLGQFFGHQVSDLWVQQVVVTVHHDVGMQELRGNRVNRTRSELQQQPS